MEEGGSTGSRTAFRFFWLGAEGGTAALFIAEGSGNLAESGTSMGSTRRLASARRILA